MGELIQEEIARSTEAREDARLRDLIQRAWFQRLAEQGIGPAEVFAERCAADAAAIDAALSRRRLSAEP